jgi:hypothetical protein
MKKVVFCPKCHKPIKVPDFIEKLTVVAGFVTFECGNVTQFASGKQTKCTGKVKLKTQ